MSQPRGSGFFLTVNEDDKITRYPLFSHLSDWVRGVTFTSDNSSITINQTLANNGSIKFDFLASRTPALNYAFMEILNKRFSFTVDVSNVPSTHNFALYTCALTNFEPCKDAQSEDSRTEIDLMEANRVAYHFTVHKRFDKGGKLKMGIGGSIERWNKPAHRFTSGTTLPAAQLYGFAKYIDTRRPFDVQVSITSEKVRLHLTQNGKNIWQEMGGQHLDELLPEIIGKKHVLMFSLWTAPSMSWLSGGIPVPPDDSRIKSVYATISNIKITSIRK